MAQGDYPAGALLSSFIERITVPSESSLYHAMTAMEMAGEYGLPAGLSIVLDDDQHLIGVITDGDVREALLRDQGIDTPVTEVMTRNPVAVLEDTPVEHVLDDIRQQVRESGRDRAIKHAVLVDGQRTVVGIIDVDRLALSHSWQWDTVGVIGLGYVGLTVGISLAESGFEVIGWDRDEGISTDLRRGIPSMFEVGLADLLKTQLDRRRLAIAASSEELSKCKIFLVCVSTPVSDNSPDMTYFKEALADLTSNLKPGDLVVIRSTVPIGTCRKVVVSIIEDRTPFVVGREISLAFAPERTVAGRALEELRSLPQIIGGFNNWSTDAAARIFSRLSPTIVRLDTLEEAEFVKLMNNTFRDLSFAFANEIALMSEAYNLDATKLIHAANSGYPRNQISLPSPGVGGPCLTKDPYIYASSSNEMSTSSLAEAGRRINEQVPVHIAGRLLDALRECGKDPSDCAIFVLGLAFKGEPETDDLRESPALKLIAALRNEIGSIHGYDPIARKTRIADLGITWKAIEEGFEGTDAVLFMNNHRSFAGIPIYQLAERLNRPAILFDGWSFFDQEGIERIRGVRYMGLGYLTPWVMGM